MKSNLFLTVGIVLLMLAALWRFGLSAYWTQCVPVNWTWDSSIIGVQSNADPVTGQLPAEDVTGIYERSIKVTSDANRPQSVTLEDHYLVHDANTGQIIYEYGYRAPVDPVTGAHLKPENAAIIFSFRGMWKRNV